MVINHIIMQKLIVTILGFLIISAFVGGAGNSIVMGQQNIFPNDVLFRPSLTFTGNINTTEHFDVSGNYTTPSSFNNNISTVDTLLDIRAFDIDVMNFTNTDTLNITGTITTAQDKIVSIYGLDKPNYDIINSTFYGNTTGIIEISGNNLESIQLYPTGNFVIDGDNVTLTFNNITSESTSTTSSMVKQAFATPQEEEEGGEDTTVVIDNPSIGDGELGCSRCG